MLILCRSLCRVLCPPRRGRCNSCAEPLPQQRLGKVYSFCMPHHPQWPLAKPFQTHFCCQVVFSPCLSCSTDSSVGTGGEMDDDVGEWFGQATLGLPLFATNIASEYWSQTLWIGHNSVTVWTVLASDLAYTVHTHTQRIWRYSVENPCPGDRTLSHGQASAKI